MELMRLRKAEAELGGRVRALESEVKAGKAARAALEAALEEAQAAGRVSGRLRPLGRVFTVKDLSIQGLPIQALR